MRDTLENLYFGNITPNDQVVKSGTTLKKDMEQSAECEEKLTALLEPLFLPLVQVVLFVLLCLVVRWVFALLVRLLRGVNALPLLGGANRLLGLCLGLVTGALDCWLVALALGFAAGITAGKLDWLTPAALQQSIGYSFFGAFNPFLVHY